MNRPIRDAAAPKVATENSSAPGRTTVWSRTVTPARGKAASVTFRPTGHVSGIERALWAAHFKKARQGTITADLAGDLRDFREALLAVLSEGLAGLELPNEVVGGRQQRLDPTQRDPSRPEKARRRWSGRKRNPSVAESVGGALAPMPSPRRPAAELGDAMDRLRQALESQGDPMTVDQYLAVAEQVADRAEALSAGERSFLLEKTDITADDLTDESQAIAHMALRAGQTRAGVEVTERSLTTKQVAALTGRAESNIRRSRLDGSLYAPDAEPGQSLRFPNWQFTDDGRALPGLREILAVLPEWEHPLSVERFMTTANDALDSMSPRDWLASNGASERVVALAEELGYS